MATCGSGFGSNQTCLYRPSTRSFNQPRPCLEQHETPEFLPVSIDPTTKLAVQIDGQPIQDLKSNFPEQSIAFDFTLPSDNLFNAEGEGPFNAGTYSLGVDDGIYVMLAPLSKGNHTLHFTGTFPGTFLVDITYHLSVN